MLTDWLRRLRNYSAVTAQSRTRRARRGHGGLPLSLVAAKSLEPRVLLAASPIGGEFKVNTYTLGQQRTFPESTQSVAMDGSGNFVVTWSSQYQDGSGFGVYAQRYNASGVAQGSEFRVNTYTSGDQRNSNVAMDSSGNFVITWTSQQESAGFDGIYAQRYNAAGIAQGGEFHVNTFTNNTQEFSSVAMDSSGNFVVAWTSNGPDGSGDGIFAQRYNAAGAAQGGEFQVNNYTSFTQTHASVAMDTDGDFVIAWHSSSQDGSGYGIYAQRYNAAGAAQGSEFRVNTTVSSTQRDPSVDMDSNGNFVVAWTSTVQDSGTAGVYAQRYDSAGMALGTEFAVNSYTSNNQGNASVAMDASGKFVISWSSNLQDGGLYGVYAKTYNAAGVAQSGDLPVNTFTNNDQRHSTVATDADGDFVVVWTSSGQDSSGAGVYAQRFLENSAPTDIGLTPASVAENQPAGTTVGLFNTVDPDTGDTFTYSLVPGPGGFDNASFTIVGDQLLTNASFDFETQNSYSIRVRSTDQGGANFTKIFTITVTDVVENPPTSISLNPLTIPENRPIGTTVGAFSTVDPDVGDTFTYTLVAGPGSTDNASFTIFGNQLQSAAVFDFEMKNSYDIRVRSTDQTGMFFEETFTVQVTNLTENPPTNLTLSVTTVQENRPVGTNVGTFVTTDPDAADTTFTYALVPGTGSTDNASFTIVGNQLQTAAVFNFEAKSSYSIRVRSTDPGNLSIERTFTVNVINLNEVPTITLVNKLATLGEATSTVNPIRVADIVLQDDGTGTNVVSLSGADAALFEIAGNQLRLRSGVALDFETKPTLTVNVLVNDDALPGTPDASVTYSLTITNANEPPKLTITNPLATILENASTQTPITVANIQIIDDALGTETLSLSGDDADLFELSGNTLRIKAGSVINYESIDDFLNVTVSVNDTAVGGTPDDSKDISIQVIDVNEAPTLIVQPVVTTLAENVPTTSDRLVAKLIINDDALGTNTFSLGGFGISPFKIVGDQLLLKAGTVLDFETQNMLSATVRLDDPAVGSTPDASFNFQLTITDVNEAPKVTAQTINLPAFVRRGTIIGAVTATDPDASQTLQFTIAGGNTDGAFAINAATGQIALANPFALFRTKVFNLNVRATDSGTPAASGTAIVTIRVGSAFLIAPVGVSKSAPAKPAVYNGTQVTSQAQATTVKPKTAAVTPVPPAVPATTSLLSRALTALKPKK